MEQFICFLESFVTILAIIAGTLGGSLLTFIISAYLAGFIRELITFKEVNFNSSDNIAGGATVGVITLCIILFSLLAVLFMPEIC